MFCRLTSERFAARFGIARAGGLYCLWWCLLAARAGLSMRFRRFRLGWWLLRASTRLRVCGRGGHDRF